MPDGNHPWPEWDCAKGWVSRCDCDRCRSEREPVIRWSPSSQFSSQRMTVSKWPRDEMEMVLPVERISEGDDV